MAIADKRQHDLELLRKARQALDEGELVDRHAESSPDGASQPVLRRGDPGVLAYRGGLVRREVAGSPSQLQRSTDMRAILQRLNALFAGGLITKAQYDRKRSELLART